METATEWSSHIAGLAVDALVDNGLVSAADFERAAAVVAQEIDVRLVLGDYPPFQRNES